MSFIFLPAGKPPVYGQNITPDYQYTSDRKGSIDKKIRDMQYIGNPVCPEHLRRQAGTLDRKIDENGNGKNTNNYFHNFSRFFRKAFYDYINRDMGSHFESHAGAKKNYHHNTEELKFLAPGYRPVDQITHDHPGKRKKYQRGKGDSRDD
jgi:hypothetical protein